MVHHLRIERGGDHPDEPAAETEVETIGVAVGGVHHCSQVADMVRHAIPRSRLFEKLLQRVVAGREVGEQERAQVEEGGKVEWVSGSFGSHVSYLYPMSILKGKGAKMEFTGITFAGKGQNLDTGAKVVHAAPDTTSYINTKSISKDGGISTFRSSVVVNKNAEGAKSSVSCESLMLDAESQSDTIPAIDVRTRKADVGHEAQIGKISNEAIFYLMSRGLSEEDARVCIVSGFADNVSKELPLEYAIEMNNLIRLEMKGSIG